MRLERAISIKQPFAELILQGKKKNEYRTVPTNIRGRVYIYASQQPRTDKELWRKVRKRTHEVPYGVIVGSVEIIGCRSDAKEGYAYILRDARRLRRPWKASNRASPVFWKPRK